MSGRCGCAQRDPRRHGETALPLRRAQATQIRRQRECKTAPGSPTLLGHARAMGPTRAHDGGPRAAARRSAGLPDEHREPPDCRPRRRRRPDATAARRAPAVPGPPSPARHGAARRLHTAGLWHRPATGRCAGATATPDRRVRRLHPARLPGRRRPRRHGRRRAGDAPADSLRGQRLGRLVHLQPRLRRRRAAAVARGRHAARQRRRRVPRLAGDARVQPDPAQRLRRLRRPHAARRAALRPLRQDGLRGTGSHQPARTPAAPARWRARAAEPRPTAAAAPSPAGAAPMP